MSTTSQREIAIAGMMAEVYEINEANGWFEDIEQRTFGDDVALLHSEVPEMLEAFHDWGMEDATVGEPIQTDDGPVAIPKPEGVGSEAADVLIRLLDVCRRRGIDLVTEFERKNEYNRTRGYRHGGKRL